MFHSLSRGSSLANLIKFAPLAASLTLAACGGGGGDGGTTPTPAPTVSLSASPTTVSSGASTALTWSSTNAASCTASGGWTGSRATSGTESSPALTANTTFTLTCSNSAGATASQSVTVTVAAATPVPVVTISANPTSLAAGASSVISWSATNTPTSCTASGAWSGSKAVGGGTETVTVNATGTYSLTCANAGGSSVTQSATVTVVPAPTVSISVNPTSVTSGSTTAITWSSTNATSCTASNGWTGAKATSGTETSPALTTNTTFTLSCTGIGGTTAQSATATVSVAPPPAATATLSANPTSVASGGTTLLTWSSTNATSCTATNGAAGWAGAKATTGTQTSAALTATTTFTITCTGAGGSSAPQNATVTVTAPTSLTVSGKIAYVRPTTTASGLDYTNTETRNARGVTVEILNGAAGSTVLGTTKADASGNYTVEVSPVPASFRVRAKAELVKTGTPSFDFRVLDNTASDALYVLDSTTQTPAGATITVNLTAPLGRTGTNGTTITGTRASAPFAIIDMLYNAKELLIGAQPTVALSAMNVHWSTANTATTTAACSGNPNPVTGDIGTTFFLGAQIPAAGTCPATPPGIYVLGDATDDTDEFDLSVIAHEFGHYYEDALSRSDSMGGSHALGDKSDIRLAFSEGWGNVFSGMVLNNSTYSDTFVSAPPNNVYSFDMETDSPPSTSFEGAFNEGSVAQLIWDVFDGANDDALALGFSPIHSVMTSNIRNTTSMGSIYVMFAGLAANNPASSAALTALMTGEQISGSGEWGAGETNTAAAAASADVLPMFYEPSWAQLGSGVGVVSSNNFPDAAPTYSYNRLGARRYVRINFPASGTYTISATGPPNSDIDFVLYRRGVVACTGFNPPAADGVEQSSCAVQAAEYTLEVYDCSNLGDACTTTAPTSLRTPITVKVQ